MSRNDEIRADLRAQLSALESRYLRAKDYVKSQNHSEDRDLALEKIQAVMATPTWTREAALIAIGEIRQILFQLSDRTFVITQYESLQKSLRELPA